MPCLGSASRALKASLASQLPRSFTQTAMLKPVCAVLFVFARGAFAIAVFASGASMAAAGEPNGQTEATALRFEATPFVGIRTGGDFELGDDERDVDIADARALALA